MNHISLSILDSRWALAITAAAGLLGLALLTLGLFADRSRGRRRCPRCYYDLPGANFFPTTCPECGLSITSPHQLYRTRRRRAFIVPALALLVLAISHVGYAFGRRAYYAVMPRWKTVETLRSGNVITRLMRVRNPDERAMRVVIRDKNLTVLDVEDSDISLGQVDWTLGPGSTAHKLGALDDLNGDGLPELVVFRYSGGAHCCYTVHVFTIAGNISRPITIDAGNGMAIRPAADFARAGQYNLGIPDQSFDYWHGPHATSPFPEVLYRLSTGHLEIDLHAMLRPAPSPADLDSTAAAVRRSMTGAGSIEDPQLWRSMLDLIYSGHEGEAWTFFESAWPPDRPGKKQFLAEFKTVLSASLHYQNLRAALAAHVAGEAPPAAVVPQPSGGFPL